MEKETIIVLVVTAAIVIFTVLWQRKKKVAPPPVVAAPLPMPPPPAPLLEEEETADGSVALLNSLGAVDTTTPVGNQGPVGNLGPVSPSVDKTSVLADPFLRYPDVDSEGNTLEEAFDLAGKIDELKARCASQSSCKGFTNSGRLMSVVRPNEEWSAAPGVDLYTR